jgi:hypothetical protein
MYGGERGDTLCDTCDTSYKKSENDARGFERESR